MGEPKRILVVDDDVGIREILRRFLGERGYVVATAADGEEAMRILREDPPDVLLADLKLPKISGLEILRKIQAESIDVGVIAISGYPDEEAAKKSMELGASDFIFKPLDLGYLETSIQTKLATLDS